MRLIPNPLYIKSLKPENLVKGNPSNLFNVNKPIPNNSTIYKIYSGGTTTSYGGTKK
ncbi:MAG: hypothetical protein U5M51_02360 [Emticicia sp.]|nr:hypothetical protein [Emticicia sp.]